MGQRSYLYLQNPERELFLFEANNSLPFFWLLLIDAETLERKIQDWRAFTQFKESHTEEEAEDYLQHQSNNIVLNQATFTRNLVQNRPFLRRHYADAFPLFQDFTRAIASRFAADDHIEIDISQYAAFYDTTEDFYTALRKDINAIAADQPDALQFLMPYDLVAGGSGFESLNNKEFATLPSYRAALQHRSAPVQQQVYKSDKKSRILYLVLLLLCPLFSMLTYKMYQKEGLKFTVILIGILNVGFYVFSIWSLVAGIRAAGKKHG